jgi:anti-sigma factor RsiW
MAELNHQHYEEWLLSGETLPPEPAKRLSEHLLTCEQCRVLSAGWQEVEQRLTRARLVPPAPGFTARWQARLNEERLRQKRRHALYFLAFSVGGILVLFTALAVLFWPLLQSPYTLVLALALRVGSAITLVGDLTVIGKTVLLAFSRIIPTSLWVGILVAAFSLTVIWIVALGKIALQHRSAS